MTAETSANPPTEPTTNPTEPVADPRELIRTLVRQIEMEQQRAIHGHVRLDGMQAMATTIPEPGPSLFTVAAQATQKATQEVKARARHLLEEAIKWPADIVARWNTAATTEQAKDEPAEVIDDLNYPTKIGIIETYEERDKKLAQYYERKLHKGRIPMEVIWDGAGRRWIKYTDGSSSRAF